jgi:hypothetical protein
MWRSLPLIGLLCVMLGSCSSDPAITSPVAQVALNANKAQTTEIQFLNAVRDAECRYDRLNALAMPGSGRINILTPCQTPDMTDAVFLVRKGLMSAIVEYCQALAALENVSTDQFDTNVKTTATQFSNAAKAGKFLAAFSDQLGAGAAVSSALGQMMDWIVDYYRKEHVTAMAKSNQAQLNEIIVALKEENSLIAERVYDRAQGAALSVREVGSNPRIAAMLTIYQAFWASGPSIDSEGGDEMAVHYPSATAANDALDQLGHCHDLVAGGGTLRGSKCKLDPATLKASS